MYMHLYRSGKKRVEWPGTTRSVADPIRAMMDRIAGQRRRVHDKDVLTIEGSINSGPGDDDRTRLRVVG
jgi:hypothetical protein